MQDGWEGSVVLVLSFLYSVSQLTKRLVEEKESLEFECKRWSPFGEFDPQTVAELGRAGWSIQCYQPPADTLFDFSPFIGEIPASVSGIGWTPRWCRATWGSRSRIRGSS